jgi:dTDP-4-amino-4,6-dideoxygalactose transaminase
MLNTPFSPWPSYSEEEVDAAARVLRSNKVNYWTGTEGREFEAEFANWCSAKYAVALMNGTVALEVALRALDIGPGDEVVVTPRTFVASASCVTLVGATPVFADVDRDSQNISATTIAAALSPRTKAVVCVHLAGQPCDMDPIMDLARARHLKVIEDCAQAHGARYRGRSVGTIGDIGAWSFCQDKIVTTGGEGGMITTNQKDHWSRVWAYKDHGKSWEAVYERQHPPGFRWLHESFGTNFRMLEVQAAIGRIQLRQLASWTARRAANAARIAEACRRFDVVRVPAVPEGSVHAHYRFYAFVRPECLADGWSRDRIVDSINRCGVPCYQGSCSEVYLEKAFEDGGLRPARRLPIARELGETSIMFLVHPTLLETEIAKTCSAIVEVLGAATSAARPDVHHPAP